MHDALTKREIQNYHLMQTEEATVLVSSLLRHSDNHKERVAVSTITFIVYYHPLIMSGNDHAVEGIEKFNDRFAETVAMGSYYVDYFFWMDTSLLGPGLVFDYSL